jgi:hypothetical protein
VSSDKDPRYFPIVQWQNEVSLGPYRGSIPLGEANTTRNVSSVMANDPLCQSCGLVGRVIADDIRVVLPGFIYLRRVSTRVRGIQGSHLDGRFVETGGYICDDCSLQMERCLNA